MGHLQLIINPGATSTKLALYDGETRVVQENTELDPEIMKTFEGVADQVPYRMGLIDDFMARNGIDGGSLSAVIGRGGLVFGLKTGGYRVNDMLCRALVDEEYCQLHASNLGGLLAREAADRYGIPAYIYDAVTSGDLPDMAKLTGVPEIRRRSFCHVLNSRAMAIGYARDIGRSYEDLELIVAHLGSGVSVSVHSKGEIIDSLGDDECQFSPERGGAPPALGMIKLCYSGAFTEKEMQRKIRGRGGMYAHLGTSDCRLIEQRIAEGDKEAELVFKAQAYSIAKAIGLLSVVLKGRCDAVILTGGLAYSKALTDMISEYIGYIAPIKVMPGENEMEALALGGLRILNGEEAAREYSFADKD